MKIPTASVEYNVFLFCGTFDIIQVEFLIIHRCITVRIKFKITFKVGRQIVCKEK